MDVRVRLFQHHGNLGHHDFVAAIAVETFEVDRMPAARVHPRHTVHAAILSVHDGEQKVKLEGQAVVITCIKLLLQLKFEIREMISLCLQVIAQRERQFAGRVFPRFLRMWKQAVAIITPARWQRSLFLDLDSRGGGEVWTTTRRVPCRAARHANCSCLLCISTQANLAFSVRFVCISGGLRGR